MVGEVGKKEGGVIGALLEGIALTASIRLATAAIVCVCGVKDTDSRGMQTVKSQAKQYCWSRGNTPSLISFAETANVRRLLISTGRACQTEPCQNRLAMCWSVAKYSLNQRCYDDGEIYAFTSETTRQYSDRNNIALEDPMDVWAFVQCATLALRRRKCLYSLTYVPHFCDNLHLISAILDFT